MTFQRRLALAFALMALPVVAVAGLAFRSNVLERRALEQLGEGLSRSRTFADVEAALQAQGEAIWRLLSGLDPQARRELELARQVVEYQVDHWAASLAPEERHFATSLRLLRAQVDSVTDSVVTLAGTGRREEAYRLTQRELQGRLMPALATQSREIYRQVRVASVQRAFARVESIVDGERRALAVVLALALGGGMLLAWSIARRLLRPITRLRASMAAVGAGDLEHPIAAEARDEIGDLARSFGSMTTRLREAQAQLVESEKLASVGQMSAAVAHGLRNPLASLRASAQLALRHPDAPAAREALHGIIEEVDRLDRRISHLLTFSRPASGHAIRERLDQVVQGALAPVHALLPGRRVVLAVDVPSALPEVELDPVRVEQAILEIVSNALDAMPDGGTLRVTGAPDPAGPGHVVLAVSDTGRGIPPDVLPSVTDPFFTTRAEGTGLGLAIARRFVEQNGGRLEIESAPGTGTTVRLRFPAAPRRAPQEAA
ncbi:MAG: ATP-binding protein [Gemmatimonadales bacterium]|nr:ATP-binding protein [Gemmatimonadales bacterium]